MRTTTRIAAGRWLLVLLLVFQLAEGRLVLAPEGGYNERVISECSVACISVRPVEACAQPRRVFVHASKALPRNAMLRAPLSRAPCAHTSGLLA